MLGQLGEDKIITVKCNHGHFGVCLVPVILEGIEHGTHLYTNAGMHFAL